MNAEQLLAHYERMAEAPDAIARLRRFVLDLAVRGKLVVQDARDAPTEVISPDQNGKRRGRRQSLEVIEPPYAVPNSWAWRTVATLADQVTDGEHSTPPRISERLIPLVTAKNVRDGLMDYATTDWVSEETAEKAWKRCKPAVDDILLVCVGATTGRLTVLRQPRDMVLVRSVALIRPNHDVNSEYLERAIRSPVLQEQIWASVKVSAQPCLYINRIQSLLIPVPPLAEQHRIVAKVDELMALCDQLEVACKEREAARDRLTTASLARLNAPDPDPATFTTHARFALDNLPALTTRADQIKQLRQTILNLALRGKLVEQDATDEPASELLKQILDLRKKMISTSKVRKMRPAVSPGEETEVSLPTGWAASPLQNLTDPLATLSYGVLVPGPDVEDGVPFVRAQDLMLAKHPDKPGKTIAHEIEAPFAKTRLRGGEILLCVVGSIGKLGVVPPKWAGANIARAVVRIAPIQLISSAYLLLFFQSDSAQNFFLDVTRTLAQPTLNIGLLEKLPVSIPPRAEQDRIVAKVHKLMTLCDQLEAYLAAGDETRQRLLEAILHEALEPTETRELEPA